MCGCFLFGGLAMGKKVFCPSCGRAVMNNVHGSITVSAKCRKCKKLIVYNPEFGEITSKPMPLRASSSGCRFW